MKKQDFIKSYINKLQQYTEQYKKSNLPEEKLVDLMEEVRGIFKHDMPEIESAVSFNDGTVLRDANILEGILQMHEIEIVESDEAVTETEYEKFFRELKLEYIGIRKTINSYTNDGNIINYLDQLNEAITVCNIDNIKYCLSAVLKWYMKNICKIHANAFVTNADSHDENLEKIKRFKKAFENAPKNCLKAKDAKDAKVSSNEPIIFLSHKSDDKKYADALEKFIIGLGVKNNQLIYTSHPLHKIPLDSNIYDYLRTRINSNVFMIFLWSDKYLESPACMNEMGAAWVIQSDYTNIYVPSFSFGNPKYRECAVDTRKMGAVLNGNEHCKASMIELKNKIQNIFKLENDEQDFQYLLDTFIKEIQEK